MNDKKDLVKEINNLSTHEHMEIFKIIKNSTDKYTKNDNGIFINLSVLDDNILEQINNFVIFCIENKDRLEKKEEIIRCEKDKMFKNLTVYNDESHNEKNIIDDKEQPEDDKEENEVQNSDDDEEEEMEGVKISLKRLKPKYNGVKAKIIKNYKQSSNILPVVYKHRKNKITTKDENTSEINDEYDIGEEIYDNDGDNVDTYEDEDVESINE